MNSLLRSLVTMAVSLVFVATCTAQTKTATFHTYNLSFAGEGLTRLDKTYGTVTTYITTYDGRTDVYPLHDTSNGLFLFSEEFRPRAGVASTYEADFIEQISVGYLDYGSIVLRLSNTNTDQSGLPDLVNGDRAFNSDITGTMQVDAPTASTRAVHGHMYRSAGATLGTISYWTGSGAFTNVTAQVGCEPLGRKG
jgi:hypothetical protein